MKKLDTFVPYQGFCKHEYTMNFVEFLLEFPPSHVKAVVDEKAFDFEENVLFRFNEKKGFYEIFKEDGKPIKGLKGKSFSSVTSAMIPSKETTVERVYGDSSEGGPLLEVLYQDMIGFFKQVFTVETLPLFVKFDPFAPFSNILHNCIDPIVDAFDKIHLHVWLKVVTRPCIVYLVSGDPQNPVFACFGTSFDLRFVEFYAQRLLIDHLGERENYTEEYSIRARNNDTFQHLQPFGVHTSPWHPNCLQSATDIEISVFPLSRTRKFLSSKKDVKP